MTCRYLVMDVFDGLATLDDNSVDLIVSSPPFLALRSYLPADHPDKAKEIGSEKTPGEFLDVLLDVVEACARVLAPHGSLVFELGDTYAGSTSGLAVYSDDRGNPDGMRDQTFGGANTRNGGGKGWPLDKSKVLVPQLFAVALAYGFNPLTGRETEPWRVRNTVAWCRPNPPVGRDGDKFRPATSFLTVATKSRDRYWDGDAVRTPLKDSPGNRYERRTTERDAVSGTQPSANGRGGNTITKSYFPGDSAGAPLLDWWEIPTHPFRGQHYATFPPALVVPLVKSMCPQRVCRVCGEPSRRITAAADGYADKLGSSWADRENGRGKAATTNRNRHSGQPVGDHIESAQYETLGWSDCGHDNWRPGQVLDPFAGSGTTLAVASGHGLDSVGIDLDPRNADLARERCGMFLEVEYPEHAA